MDNIEWREAMKIFCKYEESNQENNNVVHSIAMKISELEEVTIGNATTFMNLLHFQMYRIDALEDKCQQFHWKEVS
jgi:hypothetical protein